MNVAADLRTASTPRPGPAVRQAGRLGLGAVATVGLLLLSACGSGGVDEDGGSSSAEASAGSDLTGCLMVSSAGVADRSFNQQAWAAMQETGSSTGMEVKYLAQSGSIDYPQIGDQFVQEGCNVIVGMGFNTADTIQALAPENPDITFVLIDSILETPVDNAVSLHFATDQASFLAGYLAAGVTQTDRVGVVGNVAIPPVTLYMDGYVNGVRYYNEQNGTDVQAIGWDPDTQTGTFVGNFTDTSRGQQLAQSEIDQGADVLLPLIGGADQAVRGAGGPDSGYYLFWPDTDGCVSNETVCDLLLSSVLKNIQTSLVDVLGTVVDDTFEDGTYEGTLGNGGVGIAPFHDNEDAVPADLADQLTQLQDAIAAGEVTTS